MSGLKRLIDFRGHAKRGEYWAISVGASAVSFALGAISGVAPQSPVMSLFTLVVVFFVVLPIHSAAAVRRLHDRGKSGWWVFLFLGVPFGFGFFAPLLAHSGAPASPPMVVGLVGFLVVIAWAFIELCILPGKTKGNRYLGAADPRLLAAFD